MDGAAYDGATAALRVPLTTPASGSASTIVELAAPLDARLSGMRGALRRAWPAARLCFVGVDRPDEGARVHPRGAQER